VADIGTGTSIAFGTSTFAPEIIDLKFSSISRPVIKTSHLGTTVADTFMPGDLVDYGTCEVEYQFCPTTTLLTKYIPPITSVAETITISFPLYSGAAAKATAAGSGFVSTYSLAEPHEDLQTGTFTIKWSGAVTFTAAS